MADYKEVKLDGPLFLRLRTLAIDCNLNCKGMSRGNKPTLFLFNIFNMFANGLIKWGTRHLLSRSSSSHDVAFKQLNGKKAARTSLRGYGVKNRALTCGANSPWFNTCNIQMLFLLSGFKVVGKKKRQS